jgi:hypothetical protein
MIFLLAVEQVNNPIQTANIFGWLGVLTGLVGAAVAVWTVINSRKNAKEATEVSVAAQKIDDRLGEFTIMKGTIETLNQEMLRLKAALQEERRARLQQRVWLEHHYRDRHPGEKVPEMEVS